MKKISIAIAACAVSLLAPLGASAVILPLLPNVILDINTLLNGIFTIIWIIFAAYAVIMFIMAGIQFLSAQGEAEKVGKARQSVLWGAVGIIVALLAFSIPIILKNTLGI